MNENNYKTLDGYRFLRILDGSEPGFHIPMGGNLWAQVKTEHQAYRAAGIEPEVNVLIPPHHERIPHKLEMSMGSRPSNLWPDFNDPIIYRIDGSLYWNRGLNFATGEGPKPELTFGSDLLNCQFLTTFSIYDVKSKGILILRNCKLASKIDDRNPNYIHTEGGGLLMRSCEFKRVEFHGLTGLRDDLEIAASSIDLTDLKTNELRLEGCFVENLIIKGDNTEIKKIIIKNSSIKSININCKGIEEVYIQNLKNNKSLGILCDAKLLEVSTDKELEGANYIINSVDFNFHNTSKNGRYLFENLTVESLSVSGNNSNYVLLRNNFIESIILKDFNNYSGFAIHNSQNIKSLTIQDSSLGKSEFLDVGFFKKSSIRIVHSNISEAILFSTVFPETLTADSVDDFRGLREAYRQLKFVSGKQGDRVNELRYEAYEMNAYKKDSTTHKSTTDKFILFTNQISNRHGQSAWQALTMLILGSALLYGLIKFCQGFPVDLDNSVYTISEYINFFVNPLHDYLKLFSIEQKEEFGYPYPGIARLLDTVGKLFSGYFIFQFLRAFRKFAK